MDRATFETTYANSGGTFADNTTRAIDEGDLRQFATDILNTFEIGASSVRSTQSFEIGGWNMNIQNNGVQGASKNLVYCGPSSNITAVKYFGVEVVTDSDASFLARYSSPHFYYGFSGPAFYHSGLFQIGSSAAINLFAASGSLFITTSDWNDSTVNRGYITLFF